MRNLGPPHDRQLVKPKGPQMIEVDVDVENHGTIFVFNLFTERALQWVDEHATVAEWQWFGRALVVDHRLAADLAAGMQRSGLKVT
jgi:hypothetical protein